ncbi:CYTH domain-containing protein [Shewanella eurypsychrophilus]|uniref:CYTH domain-containing protein n=1 Tax=Shewanella eurypsychrophilus TaxID=2593656 RepID=A0ABX6VA91_9GAMM|nr:MULTISPECIES: CYTH domain-containing protein [Shewanella]QFU24377.1 CYTH domain-containing protein [Shewanella sp. YLB-09]QPG59577.1 CYTH domain-containing protein [Shewanella eurypsychrophilus]
MNAEIELKLFFQLEQQQTLVNLLDSLPNSEQKACRKLTNGYFETPDLQLRKWDMGLRVRGYDGHREQTIKTAGSVIGGIHSRPEYNVDIEQDVPNLHLFPKEIWPQPANISAVQSQLTCLFDTDFDRRTWHIYVDESLIEVALDIGQVSVTRDGETKSEPICELEFELMAGKTAALIELGSKVAESVAVRLGKASKAQRGYRLAAQSSPLSLDVLKFIELETEQDLKLTLISLLSSGIERWQQLEAMILESCLHDIEQLPFLCYRLRACVRLLRCTLEQFNLLNDQHIARFDCIEAHLDFVEIGLSLTEILSQNSQLIAKLSCKKQLESQTRKALASLAIPCLFNKMLADTCYGSLQLGLVEILFGVRDGEVSVNIQTELMVFADRMQEASWQKIVGLMPSESDLTSKEYQSLARALDDSIFVGVAYGELYAKESRDVFRAPWQDLVLGIRTLAAYRKLREISLALGVDISDWLQNKEASLIFAMEQSRRTALKNQPYWR